MPTIGNILYESVRESLIQNCRTTKCTYRAGVCDQTALEYDSRQYFEVQNYLRLTDTDFYRLSDPFTTPYVCRDSPLPGA